MPKLNTISFSCRKICYCTAFALITILLYGCPFSSIYKLDNETDIPVDESLLGKWSTTVLNKSNSEIPLVMMLDKKNENEYAVVFTGNLNDLKRYKVVQNDSIKGSAFMSIVANRQFLNIEVRGQTYISQLIFQNNTLSLLAVGDGFTSKYIKSNSDLRKALELHFRTRINPNFDDQFCLRNMVRVN